MSEEQKLKCGWEVAFTLRTQHGFVQLTLLHSQRRGERASHIQRVGRAIWVCGGLQVTEDWR